MERSEEMMPSVYVVFAHGTRGEAVEVQIVGVYESESEAREVAQTRDKHVAGAHPDVKWQPHTVEKTELFKASLQPQG